MSFSGKSSIDKFVIDSMFFVNIYTINLSIEDLPEKDIEQ
jgi:hypothetical protein